MTPTPYVFEAHRSSEDGRFYGTVKYSGTVVAEMKFSSDEGVKTEEAFFKWGLEQAQMHKASISPSPSHQVTRSIVL